MTDHYAADRADRSNELTHLGLLAARLVIPVLALLAVYAAAFQGLATPIVSLDRFSDERWFLNPSHWLTAGHFLLPLTWLVVALTNRRYGAGLALSAFFVSWLLVAAVGAYAVSVADSIFPHSPLPPRRVCLAFVFSFFLGQIIGIYVFDRTRGRTWWGAPLLSALWGQSAFIVTFYPLVYLELVAPWPNFMFMDLGLKIVAAVVMLVPYYLLRPVLKPRTGLGGR